MVENTKAEEERRPLCPGRGGVCYLARSVRKESMQWQQAREVLEQVMKGDQWKKPGFKDG
jgi:hypothetical protein